MKRIYLLFNSYTPNTATANRMLAYLSSLDKMRVPVQGVFFLPDAKKSKIDVHYDYVSVKYYWDKFYLNNRVLKYISYYFYLLFFKFKLAKGDKVYVYGEDYLVHRIIGSKGIDVFFEKTENPEVALSFNRLYHPSLADHIELCKRVKALFVISQSLKDYYIEKGVEAKRIHIINIIVDAERFLTVQKMEDREKYIAYCGTAANNKDGVDQLIKAFALVVKSHPEVKLYIIGKAPSKDVAFENGTLIKKLGLEEKVVLTGIVSAEQMPSLLKNAYLLALARPKNMISQYGFPTKMGEYLLTSNPVVVTAVGDIPRFLKDGESAFVVPPDDIEAFAEKIVYALDHPEESKKIGEKGCEVALDSFDSVKETKKLIEIMNEQ